MKAATLLLVALFAATADAKCYGGAFFGHFRGHWYDTSDPATESALVVVPNTGKKIKIYNFRTATGGTGKYFFVGRGGPIATAVAALDARTAGNQDQSHDPVGGTGIFNIASTDAISDATAAEFDLDLGDAAKTDYTGGNANKPTEPAKAADVLWLALHEHGADTMYGFVEFVPFLRSGEFKKFGNLQNAYAEVTIANSEATAFTTASGSLTDPGNVRYYAGTKPYEQSYMELIKLVESAENPDKGIYHVSTAAINALNAGAFQGGRKAADFKWLAVYEGGATPATKRVLTYLKNCD